MADLSPRQWGKGDPEPADRPMVRDRHSDVWTWHPTGVWTTPETMPCTWEYIARKFHPLTEVLPEVPTITVSSGVAAALTRARVARAIDNGEEIEVPGLGIVAPDEQPVPAAQSSQDAPNPVSLVSGGQGSGETPATDELRAELRELLSAAIATGAVHSMEAWERADEDLKNTWRLYGMRAADALLAAGWRPPQTTLRAKELEVDGEAGAWYVRILDEDVHHTTEGAPVNIDWTRDGTMIGVEILGSADKEPEWDYGYRHNGGRHVLGPVSEQWAWQKNREIGATVWRRRSVGPWEQVERS